MLQCLALLLFKECNVLLNPWEIEVWAATETVLWNLLCQQIAEESEIYLRHCEMRKVGSATDFEDTVVGLFRMLLCSALTTRRAAVRWVRKRSVRGFGCVAVCRLITNVTSIAC